MPAALRRPAARHPAHARCSSSGGEAALVADAARRRGRAVRRADRGQRARAARGARRAGGAGQPARLPHLRLGRPGRDGRGVHGDGPRPGGPAPALRRPAARRPLRRRRLGLADHRVRPGLRAADARGRAGRGDGGEPDRASGRPTWVRRGLAVLAPPAVAMEAVEAAATIGRAWAGPLAPPPVAGPQRAASGGARPVLNEATGQAAAPRRTGCRCPPGRCARARAPRWSPRPTCAGPVAVKGLGVAHKTEQRRRPARPGRARRRPRRPPPSCWPGSRRCWSSGWCRAGSSSCWSAWRADPVFGPVLSLGVGGVLTELVRDVAHLVLPVRRRPRSARALLGLRCAPLLTGYRGAPPADLDRLVDVVGRVAELVLGRPEVVVAGDQPVDRHGGRGVGVRRAGRRSGESMSAVRTRRLGAVLEVTLDRPPANAIDLATSRAMGRGLRRLPRRPRAAGRRAAHRGRAVLQRGMGPQGGRGGRRRGRRLRGGRLRRHPGAAGAEQAGDRARRGHGGGRRVRAGPVLRPDLRGRHRVVRAPRDQRGHPGRRGDAAAARPDPHHIAMELLLTGRWMDAAEAHRWGLVNEVHPADRLAERVLEVADPAGRGAAAGVRGDQGGAAGEPAADVRRGHARGSRRASSRPWPRCTPRRTSGRGPGRSPRSAARCGRGAERVGAHGQEHGTDTDMDTDTDTGTARMRGRSPPRRVHRAAARRPRPGAGVQPPAGAADRGQRRHHRTVAVLDPDPLRYMWVDEGDGQIPAQLARAAAVLDSAPRLAGQTRGTARIGRGQPQRGPPQRRGARRDPAGRLAGVAGGPRRPAGRRAAHGDRAHRDGRGRGPRGPVPPDRGRSPPTARPWLLFGRSVDGRGRGVGHAGSATDAVERAGAGQRHRASPSFNQEVVAHRRRQPATCAGRAGRATGSASSPVAGRRRLGATDDGERGGRGQRLGPDPGRRPAAASPTHGPSTRDGSYARRRCAGVEPTAPGPSPAAHRRHRLRPAPAAWPRPPTAGCGAPST